MTEQIAVFLENQKGRLEEMTKVLSDEKIDLIALTIADTKEFGIVRFITHENDKVLKVLKESGFTASKTKLLAVEVDDAPGGLHSVLRLLSPVIEIEYLYSFARREEKKAIILFKVNDFAKAEETLKGSGITIVEDVNQL